jgi:hypothetical protein
LSPWAVYRQCVILDPWRDDPEVSTDEEQEGDGDEVSSFILWGIGTGIYWFYILKKIW